MTPARRDATIVGLAVASAGAIGTLDFHASEVQPAVALLLLSSAALAYAAPARGWVVALILGVSVQATHLIADALGIAQRYPMQPRWSGLLALVPSTIGAVVGAAIGAMVRASRSESRTRSRG